MDKSELPKKLLTASKKHWRVLILLLLCAAMFYQYAFISLNSGAKFYSPDETANYFFIKQFHDTGKLYALEPQNPANHNIIFPRSVNILGEKLVPQSFPGMLLFYGLASRVVGLRAISFLSPLLALISILLFYLFVKTIFDKNIAFVSSLILSILPAFWFNSGKAMMHTSLFCFFLILGLYLFYKPTNKLIWLMKLASGLAFGGAIFVRTSEIIWLFPAIIIALLLDPKKNRKTFWFVLIGFIIPVMGLFVLNLAIYGKIFSIGYQSLNATTEQSNTLLHFASSVLLPFGLNPRALIFQIFQYFIKCTWYITLPAIFSLTYFAKHWREQSSELKSLLGFSIIATFISLLFYGNYWPWGLSGQPESPTFLIGSPHLRYWLPITILLIPFAAHFIWIHLPKLLNSDRARTKLILSLVFIFSLGIIAVSQVLFDPEEGYLKIVSDINEFTPRIEQVKMFVPSNSIIVVPDWADRIFFPEYRVVISAEDQNVHQGDVFADLNNLGKTNQTFYYTASSEKDIDILRSNRLKPVGLDLQKVSNVYKGERLYKFIELKK